MAIGPTYLSDEPLIPEPRICEVHADAENLHGSRAPSTCQIPTE
jgi:hypothetical protein